MAGSDGISGVHREIAAENGSPIRVLAGPGTGKTFAMMRLIARLLTVTRTASRDLKAQLAALGVESAESVRATDRRRHNPRNGRPCHADDTVTP